MAHPEFSSAAGKLESELPISSLTVAAARLRVRPIARYGASVLLSALGTAVTAGISPVVETYTVNVYVMAIVLAAWYGGLGPGLLATALSTAALDFFFVPPYFDFWPLHTSDAVRMSLFLLAGFTISWVSHLLRRAVRAVSTSAEQIAASATLFRHTFEQAAVGIAHVGLDGRWLRINARLAEILGYAPETLRARTFQEITHPDDLDADLAHLRELLRGEASRYAMDKRYLRADGSVVWIRLTVSLVRDAEGAPDYFIAVVEDIDARKLAEAERARFGAMLERIADGVVVLDGPDLRVRYLNAQAERTWRRPAAECLGASLLELSPGLAGTSAYRDTERAVLEQTPVQFEVFYPAEGAWYEVNAHPTSDGTARGALILFRDVTARHETAARLEEARHQAEAGHRAKSSFLAAMSHEIRTPIHAMGGYVEMLELGLAGPLTDMQRRYLERTRQAGRTLMAIVNDVLDLSRIEAGKASVERRVASVAPTVASALDLLMPQASEKGVSVVNACSRDVSYWGDETRVLQILTNLVGNAVKFTPPGGRITVLCGSADRTPAELDGLADDTDRTWTIIRVQDTGIGIDAASMDRIFGAFEQVDDGLTRTQGGAGLGLTISRHLARLMGGDVTVESIPGEGSSFMLRLPAPAAHATSSDTPATSDRRCGTREAHDLHVIGETLLREIERIVIAHLKRLREDPSTVSARALSDAQLADHTASLIADIAQTLVIVDAAAGAPSDMLRDSSAIQRMVADRHGAFRARLGWQESEVVREFAILREEIAAAVRRRPEWGEAGPPAEAAALLQRLAAHAEHASLTAFRRMAGKRDGETIAPA